MIPAGHMVVGGVVSAAIAAIGTLLNSLRCRASLHLPSLLVLCTDRKLRTNPTTLLIIFLSTSNLVYTALVLPLNSLAMLQPRYMEEHQLLCQIFAVLFYWSFVSMLFLEAALAVNRWAAVCTRRLRFGRRGSWVALVASWVSALLLLLPSASGSWGTVGWDPHSRLCTVSTGASSVPISVLLTACTAAPYLVILSCYVLILVTLRRSARKVAGGLNRSVVEGGVTPANSVPSHLNQQRPGETQEMRRRELGMTRTVCAILTNYLVCTVPAATVLAMDPSATSLARVHVPTYVLSWLVAVLNPILYVLCNPAYR